jgi:hypothetical protein
LSFILLGSGIAAIAATSAPSKPHKLQVRFLARGTAIYSSFSGSQAEYLVEVSDAGKVPHFARLLYLHRNTHPEIPDELVDSGKVLTWHLDRQDGCDESYNTLATAWLPEEGQYASVRVAKALHFVSGVTKPEISGEQVIPCYVLSPHNVHWRRMSITVK